MESLLLYVKSLALKTYFNFHRLIGDPTRGLNFERVEIEPEQFGYDSKIVCPSQPGGGYELYKLFSKLDIQPSDSIIDIGAGQGSAMRTMHKFPFKKMDGIELIKEIAAIAIKNFTIIKNVHSNIFIEDAVNFKSYADYNIFFLYNPFSSKILEKVIANINDSIIGIDRESIIIYLNPYYRDTILNNSNFTLMVETDTRWDTVHIYTNRPKETSRLKGMV